MKFSWRATLVFIALLAAILMFGCAEAAEPIVVVPAGRSVSAEVTSYLLPEAKYDRCLANSLELREVKAEIASSRERLVAAIGKADEAMTTCKERMMTDAVDIATLQATGAVLADRIEDLKGQRNIAWAVTGSLVAGATVAIILTTGS